MNPHTRPEVRVLVSEKAMVPQGVVFGIIEDAIYVRIVYRRSIRHPDRYGITRRLCSLLVFDPAGLST